MSQSKFCFWIFYFAFALGLGAQDIHYYAFASPLKLIDNSNPGVLYGGGITLPNRFAIEIGHLILLPYPWQIPEAKHTRGNRFHLSFRRYLKENYKDGSRPYFQFRGDLLNRKHESVITISSLTDQGTGQRNNYQDSVTVLAGVTTLNVMFGVERPIGKNFFVDLSIGLGTRSRNIRHEGRIEPLDQFYDTSNAEDFYARNTPGRTGGQLNIPLDVRLLYRFN